MALWQWYKSFYLTDRFFAVLGGLITLYVFGFFFVSLYAVANVLAVLTAAVLIFDAFLLYRTPKGVQAERTAGNKFSNGDENPVSLSIRNYYPFEVSVTIIDEIPVEFQKRDFRIQVAMTSGTAKSVTYYLRPVRRGEYIFGAVNLLVASPLGLARRRYQDRADMSVAVYPSFIRLRKFQLLAVSDKLSELGVKRMRRLGRTTEFDHIKEYVRGDDYRTINWQATSRRNNLMVNKYEDERSQQVYCAVDTGRIMKMPFDDLTLVDHAINSALVLSNIAVQKDDKAGLIAFSDKINALVKAEQRPAHMRKIQEALYRTETDFAETDFEKLYATLTYTLPQRSLILLYTNFETLSGMQRQLPYIRKIADKHLPVVIFFENTEVSSMLGSTAERTEDIYINTIAEKYMYEKRQIVRELTKYGIPSILTPPESLTVNAINKYLEIKARRLL